MIDFSSLILFMKNNIVNYNLSIITKLICSKKILKKKPAIVMLIYLEVMTERNIQK